jgi:hypothetical protein
MKQPRLTHDQFVAILDVMGIDTVVEERYVERDSGTSYVQWEFERGFCHRDGEINWRKQLERIKAIRKAQAERSKHNTEVMARGGSTDELMLSLPLPDWARS